MAESADRARDRGAERNRSCERSSVTHPALDATSLASLAAVRLEQKRRVKVALDALEAARRKGLALLATRPLRRCRQRNLIGRSAVNESL